MDKEEAQRIVDAYGDAVYRLAYTYTGNRSDAEDVTQETFLRLLRDAPNFREEGHRKAWLLRVAVNCAKDLHRSPWRRRSAPLAEAESLPAPPEPDSGLLEAVLSLPEKFRAVVHLYYYEGYSAAEIAQLLGKSVSAVNTRLSRARAMLRDSLKEVDGYDRETV